MLNSGRLGGAAFVLAGNTSIDGGCFRSNTRGAIACQDCSAVKLVDTNKAMEAHLNAAALFGRAADHVILDNVHMSSSR